ncbi:hypothetical protein [Reyranella sp.]|uniref:hypothetical protein n=1 Tax=Reyranella sp. TaxID=1929291 RepID=UPI0011F99694|nr:hypothetical protein [Reyranella sp.]TAJ84555.1 MAG: deoxynucleotide monophosphate kinase [Reyranella sp.]
MLVLALTGSAGSGKSTVADHLVLRHGFRRLRFGDPLKTMLGALIAAQGQPPDYVKRCLEGDLKTRPVRELAGRTPRHALQSLSQGWGREAIGPDLWVQCWRGAVEPMLQAGPVVAEDCSRFDEVDMVRTMGGLVWRIVREDEAVTPDPEQASFEVDANLLNNGAVPALLLHVNQLLRDHVRRQQTRNK